MLKTMPRIFKSSVNVNCCNDGKDNEANGRVWYFLSWRTPNMALYIWYILIKCYLKILLLLFVKL